MDESKPSKNRKPRVSKKNPPLPPKVEEELLPISKIEAINIENVFKQALTSYKEETFAKKKESYKELTHLGKIVEEYLGCFALIGFTMKGEKVCMINATNDRDEGALVDLLRTTFMDIANNRP
jgi:hypothetical protein